MKNQALFPSNDKSKRLQCCLLQFLFGDLRVSHSRTTSILLPFQHYFIESGQWEGDNGSFVQWNPIYDRIELYLGWGRVGGGRGPKPGTDLV